MRCERCGEILVHEDEQVDGMCRKCTKRMKTTARGKCQEIKGLNPVI